MVADQSVVFHIANLDHCFLDSEKVEPVGERRLGCNAVDVELFYFVDLIPFIEEEGHANHVVPALLQVRVVVVGVIVAHWLLPANVFDVSLGDVLAHGASVDELDGDVDLLEHLDNLLLAFAIDDSSVVVDVDDLSGERSALPVSHREDR